MAEPTETAAFNPGGPQPNYRTVRDFSRLPTATPVGGDRLGENDRVLLVRLSAIGDVVRALPVVSYLRSGGFEGTLGWAVQPPCDELLRAWPGVDRVHRLDRERWWAHPMRLSKQLRAVRGGGYDWCFDLHGLLKSAAVSLASGAEHRVGFHANNAKEFNHHLQTTTIQPLPEELPRILKYLQLVRAFFPSDGLTRSRLRPDPPDFEPSTDALRRAAESNPILMHPRTSHDRYGRRKEWGVENFRSLIDRLRRTHPDHDVLITWGPGERPTARRIAKGYPDAVRAAPRTHTLTDLCYLIQRASLVLSGDTAPCHLSDVLGTPLVALFGGSDHRVSGPLLTDYRLITTHGGESTTEDIPVERVLRAVRDLLSAPHTP